MSTTNHKAVLIGPEALIAEVIIDNEVLWKAYTDLSRLEPKHPLTEAGAGVFYYLKPHAVTIQSVHGSDKPLQVASYKLEMVHLFSEYYLITHTLVTVDDSGVKRTFTGMSQVEF